MPDTLTWTRMKLAQWGRWCRGLPVTGYPTAAAFTHANEGAHAKMDGCEMPVDLAEVERIVARMPVIHRVPLLQFYASKGPLEVRAARLRTSRRTLMRRVRTAERHVHLELMTCTRPENEA